MEGEEERINEPPFSHFQPDLKTQNEAKGRRNFDLKRVKQAQTPALEIHGRHNAMVEVSGGFSIRLARHM